MLVTLSGAEDWPLWRAARLAAIADSPGAFPMAGAEWAEGGEGRWRRCAWRCSRSAGEPSRTTARELAKLCSRVENDWVGAETGLLDQLAGAARRARHALRIDFASLERRPGAARAGRLALVTVDSGATHTHAGSGYNERRAECRARLPSALGVEHAARGDAGRPRARSTARCSRRARHVLTENERVRRDGATALRDGDLAAGRPPAGRLARQPARRLRGLGARGRGDRRAR